MRFAKCFEVTKISRRYGGAIGVMHAPGFYFRSAIAHEALEANPSLLMAIGYSVVITSIAGLFLGVLWIRTKNLMAVMIVHAATDLLPNLVPFVKTFRLH